MGQESSRHTLEHYQVQLTLDTIVVMGWRDKKQKQTKDTFSLESTGKPGQEVLGKK